MNFTEFINIVKEKLTKMSEQDKSDCIYKMARMVKEEDRNTFLSFLEKEIYKKEFKLPYSVEQFHHWCSKVEEMDIYFEFYIMPDSDYMEEDEEEVYIYEDSCSLGKEINELVKQGEILIAQKQYTYAHEIYHTLWNLSFGMFYGTDGVYEDCYEYNMEQLAKYKLIDFDMKRFIRNGMYAAYQAETGRKRCEIILSYLDSEYGKEVKLEHMFETGPEELKDIPSFLDSFIQYVNNVPEAKLGTMLSEVLILRGGLAYLLEHAKKCLGHPIIYWFGFEYLWNQKKYNQCETFGLEALDNIPKELVIRGRLAERTACAAKELNHLEQEKQARLEAFYSQSTIQHFYQLYEFDDFAALTQKALLHLEQVKLGKYTDWLEEETQINVISEEEKKLILFFHGEFDKIYDLCRNDKRYLGWSSNIKGIIIPLFILLLKKNDDTTVAFRRLLSHIRFKIKNLKEEEEGEFERSFFIWKHRMNISTKQYDLYMKWLEEEVEKRTEVVVGGGLKNSYFKAELLIAALGETIESNGNEGAKKKLIEKYKKIYNNRKTFIEEMDKL